MTWTGSMPEEPGPRDAEVFFDARRGIYYARPVLRGWLHLVWFGLSVVAGPLLLAGAHGAQRITAGAIYATSVSALFGVSAVYHRGRWTQAGRARMQRLDHMMIFFLIAGTATPVLLLTSPGAFGLACLITVWTLAAAADGGCQRGQHQHPGEGEGRRVAGAAYEYAERDGTGPVPGVVGQVPQGAGGAVAGGRPTVDQQCEGDVLDDPEADPEQGHARDQDGRGRHPDQQGHPGGGDQQPGDQQAGVTVPVAVPSGLPAAPRRGHGLGEQPERGDAAGHAGRQRQERGDHPGRHGSSREDQAQPQRAAGSQAGQQAG